MNTKMALIAIFVSAVITFGLRALPFLVFQEGKELPDQIKRLGMVLPSSIMAVLIVYCLKDVGDDFMFCIALNGAAGLYGRWFMETDRSSNHCSQLQMET